MTNAPHENFALEAELDETARSDLDDPETDITIDDSDEGGAPATLTSPTQKTRCSTTGSWPAPCRTSPNGTPCAGSPGCPPSSRTSPRSSTASCASSAWCWSGSGRAHRRGRRELDGRARPAGRDGRLRGPGLQRRAKPDTATYLGSGKVDRMRDVVIATGADTVICDAELAPSQRRAWRTSQGQGHRPHRPDPRHLRPAREVQGGQGPGRAGPAQLPPAAPAWLGWSMSRQAGGQAAGGQGIGARGPGETKIELDRRRINTRMAKLRREIKDMKTTRDTSRLSRNANEVPSVAIAGYTNAGKSSLLNRLTGAGVLVENQLFATLDPTARRAATEDGRLYTLADTVGFVRHLPTSSSRPSGRPWRRWPTPTCCCTSSTARTPTPRARSAPSGRCWPMSTPPRCARSSWSTRPTPPTRGDRPLPAREALDRGLGPDRRGWTMLALIAEELPRPTIEVEVLVPYARGDLSSRLHQEAEVLSQRAHRQGHAGQGRAHEPGRQARGLRRLRSQPRPNLSRR